MYSAIRNLLFLLEPEKAHYFSMNLLKSAERLSPVKTIISDRLNVNAPALERTVFGLKFKNPVGLAAGFDKNAVYLPQLSTLGFGFVEIGTVTPLPQAGNEKPRLFRLPKDKALINRMGFNNEGVEFAKIQLQRWNDSAEKYKSKMIVGGNIGKNKITPNDRAWKDYEICFNTLFPEVDYFVVNVSSPNTPGLRELQEKDALKKIMSNLQHINSGKAIPKPLLLKIAPDLTQSQLDDIVDLAYETKLDGLVASNTTIERQGLITDTRFVSEIGTGGLSGMPLRKRSTEIVSYLSSKTSGQIPIIASGGIFSGNDADEKLRSGAALVQVWTGFIYEGPAIAKNINNYLLQVK